MLLRNLLMPKLKRLELNLEELKIYHSSYSDYVNSVLDYLTYPQGFRTDPINLESNDKYSFLISSPEKALCDLITYTPKLRPRFVKSFRLFLEEDLRLDMDGFYKMDVEILRYYAYGQICVNNNTQSIGNSISYCRCFS